MASWDQIEDDDFDIGLNNLIARHVSPHSPKTSVDRTKNFQPADHSNQFSSGRDTPSSLSGRQTPMSGRETPVDRPRYQLWPSLKKVVNGSGPRSPEGEMTLSTSQSVPILRQETSSDSMTQRWRAGSLPRRRKISVPELGLAPMTTVQEKSIDSPTIPGRFPVHERSNSAPTNDTRQSAFTECRLSTVLDDFESSPMPRYSKLRPIAINDPMRSPNSVKRASSVLLPDDETSIPILPQTTFNPLKADSTTVKEADTRESIDLPPPAVPPKSPRLKIRIAPNPAPMPTQRPAECELTTKAGTSLQTPVATTEGGVSPNPFTHWASPESINRPCNGEKSTSPPGASGHRKKNSNTQPPTPLTLTRTLSKSQSVSNLQRTRSNSNNSYTQNYSIRHRRDESEGSILDRGRPTKRIEGIVKKKLTSRYAAPDQSFGSLPTGFKANVAPLHLPADEIEAVYKQAKDQADQFEILSFKDVKELSREVRSLDERCEYLRKTHSSLREGRRELHARMISYLKSPRLATFSRESILRQEVALAELDRSIDEWITKLEYAENRRSRVRQKLLEHFAAAMIVPRQNPRPDSALGEDMTPPRSPEKEDSPRSMDRHDVESIKIYAGSEVYGLLANIEQEIENMVVPGTVY